MATGTSSGRMCYATQAEAAQDWCASVQVPVTMPTEGVGGMLTCTEIVSGASETVGGRTEIVWRSSLALPGQEPATSKMGGTVLHGCELYGLDYWEPLIPAAVTLWVAVWAINKITELFKAE